MSAPVAEYPDCFGCGQANSSGLRLRMELHGDRLKATFSPTTLHEGWPGIVHGGIMASLLYEIMENLANYLGIVTMMRSMETRYRTPARVGEVIRVDSWQERRDGREIEVRGELRGAEGRLIASGSAALAVLDPDHLAGIGSG